MSKVEKDQNLGYDVTTRERSKSIVRCQTIERSKYREKGQNSTYNQTKQKKVKQSERERSERLAPACLRQQF